MENHLSPFFDPSLITPPSRVEEYDVVIVGAGCAGLTAAISASDKGAKVIVLERYSQPRGNTIHAGGIFSAADTFVQKEQGFSDSAEELFCDMMKVSGGRGDTELTEFFAQQSSSVIRWLTQRCGVQWSPIVTEVFPGLNRGHVIAGAMKPGGRQLVKHLLDQLAEKQILVAYSNEVTSLIGDNRSGVFGVRAKDEKGKTSNFMAKGGVILCTGGFQANRELLKLYMDASVAAMPNRGSMASTGDNILLTQPFFPLYVNMDQFHAGPIYAETGANPSIMVNYGVLITREGKRFIDESSSYVTVAQRLPKLTPDNWAFIVIDDQVTNVTTVRTRLKRYADLETPVFVGQTVEEMAEKAGLMPEMIAQTINEYNQAVKVGNASSLTPPNTLDKPRLIEKPPFRCVPFQGGISATFGGPKFSVRGEVLNVENKPIPGLFGAGNAVGGLFFGDCIAGSQLTAAVLWGLIAGEEAAVRAKTMAKV